MLVTSGFGVYGSSEYLIAARRSL